jgi:hypothetical protein
MRYAYAYPTYKTPAPVLKGEKSDAFASQTPFP